MSIDVIKLIAEICILPIIGFFSTLAVTVLGGWVNHQFAKSLEQYKRQIADKSSERASNLDENKSENDSAETPEDWQWLGKVLLRGSITIISLSVWLVVTGIVFFWVQPFGLTFILNRIRELQQIPAIQQIIYELSSFIAIETLANLYLLMMAMLGGFFAVATLNAVIDAFLWILDIKP